MSFPVLLYWSAMAVGVLLTSISQVLLKLGARQGMNVLRAFLNVATVSGYALFLVVTVLNVFAMKVVPLRTVTAATSLTYVLTLALGHLILGERVTRRMCAGVALIVAGIIVYSAAGIT